MAQAKSSRTREIRERVKSRSKSRSKSKEPTKPITLQEFLDNVFPDYWDKQLLRDNDIYDNIVQNMPIHMRYTYGRNYQPDFQLDEVDNPIINTEKNIAILLSTVEDLIEDAKELYNNIDSNNTESDNEANPIQGSIEIYEKISSVLDPEDPKNKKYPKLLTEDEIKMLIFREKYENARKYRAKTSIKKIMIDHYYRPGGPYSKKMFDKYGHLFTKGTIKKKPKKKPKRKPMRQKKKQTRKR